MNLDSGIFLVGVNLIEIPAEGAVIRDFGFCDSARGRDEHLSDAEVRLS